MRHTRVIAIVIGCMLSLMANISAAQYSVNRDSKNSQLLNPLIAAPISYGTVIKDHVELKAAPFEREATLGFLYENDVFRIDDARHIHYLEVTVLNSQDAAMPGIRGWIAREFISW